MTGRIGRRRRIVIVRKVASEHDFGAFIWRGKTQVFLFIVLDHLVMTTLASLEGHRDAGGIGGEDAGAALEEGFEEEGGDGGDEFGSGGAGFFMSFSSRGVPKNTKERINKRMVRNPSTSYPILLSYPVILTTFSKKWLVGEPQQYDLSVPCCPWDEEWEGPN